MRWLSAAVLALLLAAPCAGGELLLIVSNGAEVEQAEAPVSVGVPWPAGALRSTDALRLLDPAGEERPLQAEALCRWPDGSVKWTLLDFQASVRPKGSATYRLDYGAVGRREGQPSPLVLREDASAITMSTGPARFRVSKERFALFDEVTLEGQRQPLVLPHNENDGLSLELAEGAGRPKAFLSSRGPTKAEAETKGPLRTVVRVAGRLQAEDGAQAVDYVARLHFYAGKAAARLQLTVLNREKAPELAVRDLTVRLPLRLKGLMKWEFAGERSRRDTHPGSMRKPAEHTALVQQEAASRPSCRYAVVQGSEKVGSGDLAGGAVSLWGDAGGAAVAVRSFAERNPKALRVLGVPRIEVGLLPREAAAAHKFPQGAAVTHDVLFWFSAESPPSSAALGAALDGPLAACAATPEERTCTGQWYAATGALPLAPLGSREHEARFAGDLERLLSVLEGREVQGIPHFGFRIPDSEISNHKSAISNSLGWRNYGSPVYGGFDPTLALAREFLRRGEPRLLDAAHAGARHAADIASFSVGAWLVFLLTGDRVLLDAGMRSAAFVTRHADDPDTPPLAAAGAILSLARAADLAPAFAPEHAAAFGMALDAYLGKLLDAQRLGGHGLHCDRVADETVALEALAACQGRKADPRVSASMLRAVEALASPTEFWAGHEKVGGLRAADGAQAKPYGTPDGLVADWAQHREAPAWGIACSPALPWLGWAADATGDSRFLSRARRLERVASMFQCRSPADFALRYRQGDLFAAAWERRARSQPREADGAIGLACHLESAADVALPTQGVGGCALFCPFVALPDGTRALKLQAVGAPDAALAGVWFPFLDSANVAETQGAIEFRLASEKGVPERDATLLLSGDPRADGFALSIGPKGLELASRAEGRASARIVAGGVVVKPGAWHHVALAWRRGAGMDLFFDGQKVGHTNEGRLGLAPHLRLPCEMPPAPGIENQKSKIKNLFVRDLRTWRRPPDTLPAATDNVAPAPVTDLLLAPAEEGKLLLSWTAPGHNGKAGQAHRYDVRVSTLPFRADAAWTRWAEAERIVAPKPGPAGQLEKLLIGPPPKDRRVYLAVRTEDAAGNASPLSSVVQTDANHAPVADAGPPLRQAIVASEVLFDARCSSDPDSDELSYEWSNGLKGPMASLRYDKPGSYEVTLTVSDGKLTATVATRLVVGDAIRVNFQPRRFPKTPEGFVPDEGAVYSRARGYGWRAVPAGTTGFFRRQVPGLTVEAATGLAFPSPAEWLCDLPNGTYRLTLGIGDPAMKHPHPGPLPEGEGAGEHPHPGPLPRGEGTESARRRILVEGKEVADVDLAGRSAPIILAPMKVAVADGQLNLQLGRPAGTEGGEITHLIIERQ